MEQGVYERLARHLDELPGGFPPTESGVELRILRRLFTSEEAGCALHLTLIPEEARVVARRAGIPSEEAEQLLERMAAKGLLFSLASRGRSTRYMASQFVIGIWEYHVNDLDPDLIRDVNEYVPHLMTPELWKKAPQLRTIPIGRSVTPAHHVLPYEDAERLVTAQKRLLVAPCICRRERDIMGEGCGRPEERCLVFGLGAEYYRRNGLGRLIDVSEALEILARAHEEGLVLQPSNARKIVNICCCCGCCCQVLKNLKRYPKPASLVSSPFYAVAHRDVCSGCGLCVDRCQMEALRLEDGLVVLDRDRCIGCGLCVTTCPTGALELERKGESEQPEVPKDMVSAALRLGRARGKLGTASLVGMQLKSKLDRLRAAKSSERR